jgi:uncharacterized protein YjbI with pentapeptide repeats
MSLEFFLNHSTKNVKGKKISQIFLGGTDQTNLIAGQTQYFKAFLTVIIFVLFIFSGCLLGLLGEQIAINIIVPHEGSSNIFICVTLSILSWIYFTLSCGFVKGMFRTAIATVAIMTLLAISSPLNLVFALLFTPLYLSFSILAFLTACLSFYLVDISFRHNKSIFIYFYIFLVLATSTMIASQVHLHGIVDPLPVNNLKSRNSLPTYVSFVIALSGLISGFSGVVFSLIELSAIKKHKNRFNFLMLWAISIATWGGTSFHDLDLSEVDFSGSKLANSDFRARKLYKTSLRGVTGLDRARLDDRYFDITNPKVQQLLTQGTTSDPDLRGLNLQGAYLKSAEMPNFALMDTNLTLADLSGSSLRNTNLSRANLSGADLRSADLRDSILVQTDLTGADLTGANLTGACIENWNINGRTIFTDVQCDYIYRKLDDTGKPTDHYPRDRNFEPGEFASLYQEVENAVELIFKEGINWRAFAFSLQKLQIDDEGLGLQICGIEKRGDFWVVKVTHAENVPSAIVEQKLGAAYETLKGQLIAKEQQINQLLGIATNQAEALKELSKKPFGNQFNITGSTITNLTGSGQIEYTEAANQVRNLVAHTTNASQSNQIAQQLLTQIQNHQLAPTPIAQAELIRQIILTEAENDPLFKQFILQQSANLLVAMPQGPIVTAFQTALETLQP